ncbi:peptidyl-tRNA hydrolase 2, mitochondrial-like [Mytilus trossulus]|uniref:peptidyl-tRNA hydrolase 2, mitochondrial-like n=1 Tax=Mytilus trossulus TaxID=6551 RepID=UPI003007D567
MTSFFSKDQTGYVAVGIGVGLVIGWFLRGRLRPKLSVLSAKNGSNEAVFSSDSGEYKLVFVVRNDLKMGKGKAAAQCCHAAVMSYEAVSKTDPEMFRKWRMYGQPKVVVKTETEESLLKIAREARSLGLNASLVKDAGRTQIAPGSITVTGIGPGPEELVNQVTGHLKLF